MSTLQTSERPNIYEYDTISHSEKIYYADYGATVTINGDITMGGSLSIGGSGVTVVIQGTIAHGSKLQIFGSDATIIVHGDVMPSACIQAGSNSRIDVRGYICRRVQIRTDVDSTVAVKPHPDEMTPEEYGVYEVDKLNQQLFGIDYVPHMGMPFYQWFYLQDPIPLDGR